MKTAVFFAMITMLVGCAPKMPDITVNTLSTNSGKASIILKEDGTIEIKGINIEIVGSEHVILRGQPLDLNP